eukprot:Gb_29507 [translate_table: standard]
MTLDWVQLEEEIALESKRLVSVRVVLGYILLASGGAFVVLTQFIEFVLTAEVNCLLFSGRRSLDSVSGSLITGAVGESSSPIVRPQWYSVDCNDFVVVDSAEASTVCLGVLHFIMELQNFSVVLVDACMCDIGRFHQPNVVGSCNGSRANLTSRCGLGVTEIQPFSPNHVIDTDLMNPPLVAAARVSKMVVVC